MSCGYIKPHSKETDLLVTETIKSWNRADRWRDTAAIAWPPLGKQVAFPQEEGPETTTLLIPLVFLISSQARQLLLYFLGMSGTGMEDSGNLPY